MSENHSTNNLIKQACFYCQHNVLPSWNKCIKALKSSETILQQAVDLALVDACAESIITKALNDPGLLGEPVRNVTTAIEDDSEHDENAYKPNVRRRLFVLDWKSEDLTVLAITLYEPIIRAMIHRKVPPEYVASSLFHYLTKWVFSGTTGEDDPSIYERNSQRKIIEAVERLLPQERGLIPCSWLSQMLQSAIFLDANTECKTGFEIRIGKQLDQATVKDLLIPSQGYAKEEQYDTECVKRIMKNYYSNYTGTDASGLIAVAELVDEFLAEVASDRDLQLNTFISLAELSQAASEGTHRNSDGIYRAIDIFFDKHRHLTDWEREEVCRVLDCNKISPEACEHAAQNEKLPVRVMVQILFSMQLKLKDTVAKRIRGSGNRLLKLEEDGEDARTSSSEVEMKAEMETMGSKVLELEKECSMMRREIQRGCYQQKVQKGKTSMWKEMKRKLGCMTSLHENNCHVKKKKVHPR